VFVSCSIQQVGSNTSGVETAAHRTPILDDWDNFENMENVRNVILTIRWCFDEGADASMC